MVRKIAALFAFVALFSFTPATFAQDEAAPVPQDEARKAKILANLEAQIPQLAQANPTMGDIGPSGVEGLDQGTLMLSGQPRTFLVTADDTKLWLVGGPALDVSRSSEEIAAEAARQQAERVELLARVGEGGPVRGNPDAPAVIVEYSDFQCPFCARGAETVEQLLAKYPDDVRIVFQHFPLDSIHPWARPAAIASVCAAEQNEDAFWTLHDAYFEHQKTLNVGNVIEQSKGYLADSGIDLATWEACATDESSAAYQAAAARVQEDFENGRRLGVSATPGFFADGQYFSGVHPITTFEPYIQRVKAAQAAGAGGSE